MVKPVRHAMVTGRKKRQPSDKGLPRGQVPKSQTEVHNAPTNMQCFILFGIHLAQKSLLHLPPAPVSGKLEYHNMANNAPVSLAPTQCHKGTKGTVNHPYHLSVHSCQLNS